MATGVKPTYEHIAEMLDRILGELGEVKKARDQPAADLRRIAQQSIEE